MYLYKHNIIKVNKFNNFKLFGCSYNIYSWISKKFWLSVPIIHLWLVKGDTLFVKSLDRFSRNKEEAKKELEYFASIGVRVKVIDIPTTMIDIPEGQEWIINMINNILIEVLTSVAENERQNIKQRQAEGLSVMPIDTTTGKEKSMKTGRVIGRPEIEYPENWKEIYPLWKDGIIKAVEAMNKMNLKKNSFYKLVHKYENKIA